MKTINSKTCKEAIVKKCEGILDKIADEFYPRLKDEEVKKTLEVKNWKSQYKQKDKYTIPGRILNERLFDCKPFDDQLRGYVYTDETDSSILKIIVQGE